MEYYKNDKELQKSNYGVDYRTLVSMYCTKSEIGLLRKATTFKFKKHAKYNLNDERLKLLNEMINERAIELIDIIENSDFND